MRVFIDGIIFSLQRHGGISVYFRELLSRLARDQVNTHLALFNPLQSVIDASSGISSSQRSAARIMERYRSCPCPADTELFHSSYYRLPSESRVPTVVTVHDFVYERYVLGPRRWAHSRQKFEAIRRADEVICISNATRSDLLTFVPDVNPAKVRVIYNGVADTFRPVARSGEGAAYVLFVGQRNGYKNFQMLAQSMKWLPDLQLWCVGGGAFERAETERLPVEVARRIRHVGSVDDEALNRLYNEAACCAYPSLCEGFGIPVLEAMRAGCPVVAADCVAVSEVGGNAIVVEPSSDPRAFAMAIEKAISNADSLRQKGFINAARFSWEACYQQTLDVYRSLCD